MRTKRGIAAILIIFGLLVATSSVVYAQLSRERRPWVVATQLTVNTTTELIGDVTANSNVQIDGDLTVDGVLAAGSVIDNGVIDGDLTIDGALFVTEIETWLSAEFTVSDQVGDVITVTIQLIDANDDPYEHERALMFYREDGLLGLEATGPDGGITAGEGQVIEPFDYPGFGLLKFNDDGLIEVVIEESGADVYVLILVMPDGVMRNSGAIEFTTG